MDWKFLQEPLFWTAVGSMGTVLAFIAAFVQIGAERSARKRAESEEQARKIAAWLGAPVGADGARMEAVLMNASPQPVFDVIVWLVLLQGVGARRGEDDDSGDASRHSPVGVLPPGRSVTTLPGPLLWAGMLRRPGVELTFTDATGHHWIRRGDGRLERIRSDPVKHYRLGRPVDWQGAISEEK